MTLVTLRTRRTVRTVSAHHTHRTALTRRSRGSDRSTFAREATFTARAACAGQTRRTLETGFTVLTWVARGTSSTGQTLFNDFFFKILN